MSFDEVRLPTEVEKGAVGGPMFNTSILELSSGHEQRNQNWSQSRASYDISYGIQNEDDLFEVITFFYARRGRARGFRFKDWSDYQITSRIGFAVGDGIETAFQLNRDYTSGAVTHTRNITKPVSGTVRIWVNSVEQLSGWSVDTETGIVTFSVAPTDTHIIEWLGEYDVPVRFDTDQLNVSVEIFNAGTVPSIPLVELRI